MTHWKRFGKGTTHTAGNNCKKLTDMIRDGQLYREAKESTMLVYGKPGDVSVDELNGETGVNRGVSGGDRRSKSTRIVGSGAGVRRSQTGVGGGRLNAKERFLTLRDVDGDGESIENEREEDNGACLPAGCHDGGGYIVLEGKGNGLGHLVVPKSQEHPSVLASPLLVRFPSRQQFLFSSSRRALSLSRAHSNTATGVKLSGSLGGGRGCW